MQKLIKFTPPSQYDIADPGTFWQDGDNLYIYIGKDEVAWLPVGKFLETAFNHLLSDDAFLNNCMKLYDYAIDRPDLKIIEQL